MYAWFPLGVIAIGVVAIMLEMRLVARIFRGLVKQRPPPRSLSRTIAALGTVAALGGGVFQRQSEKISRFCKRPVSRWPCQPTQVATTEPVAPVLVATVLAEAGRAVLARVEAGAEDYFFRGLDPWPVRTNNRRLVWMDAKLPNHLGAVNLTVSCFAVGFFVGDEDVEKGVALTEFRLR